MELTYIGPHAEVEIVATGQRVKRGEKVDVVDAKLAGELADRDDWEPATATKPKTKGAK